MTELKGLSHTTKIMGCGPVSWEIVDYFGTISPIHTQAYYIPDATICLPPPPPPQHYFKEHQVGTLTCDSSRTHLHLNPGSSLPIMLLNTGHSIPLASVSHADVFYTCNHALLHVSDPHNQNLLPAKKELMLWHCKFGHCDISQVQCLFANPAIHHLWKTWADGNPF